MEYVIIFFALWLIAASMDKLYCWIAEHKTIEELKKIYKACAKKRGH